MSSRAHGRTGSDHHSTLDPRVDSASAWRWLRWAEQLGQRDPGRVAGFGLVAGFGFLTAIFVLYAFAWIANEVASDATLQLDDATLAYLRQFSSPTLDLVALGISFMGSQGVFILGVLLLAFFGWRRRWGAAVLLIGITVGAQLLNDVLKELFHRTRPAPVDGFISAQQFSFPSGHAMVSAAFYFFLAYLAWRFSRRWWVTGALVVLVLLIGLARLYLGVHYLSDVVAGYMAGFLWTDSLILGSHLLTARLTVRR